MTKHFMYFDGNDGAYTGLWKSDGTVAGTYEVGGAGDAAISNVSTSYGLDPHNITAFGNNVLFRGADTQGLYDLWISDGTVGGTIEIGGINNAGVANASATGLSPFGFVGFGAKALFYGTDSANNQALWVTDGTAAGTIELGGLNNVGVAGAYAGGLGATNLTTFGNKVLFSGVDYHNLHGLWITDGTTAGTSEIGGIGNAGIANVQAGATPSHFLGLGGKAVFDWVDSTGRASLWVTDGTATGTTEIGGLKNAGVTGANVLGDVSGSATAFLTKFGTRALFLGSDTSGGFQTVWITDGTAAGTYELGGAKSAGVTGVSGAGLQQPAFFDILGNKALFFAADTKVSQALWVTDGTTSGTYEIGGTGNQGVANIGPNGFSPSAVVSGQYTAVVGNRMVFEGIDASGQRTLWSTDGTLAGTFEIGGLNNTGISGAPQTGLYTNHFYVSGNTAFFNAYDSAGVFGLWVTNGTLAGTYELSKMSGGYTGGFASTGLLSATTKDFDDGGTSDILFRRASDGIAYLFTMNDATVTNGTTLATQVNNNWQIKGVGDFDGNGSADLLWVYNNASNSSDPLNGISYVTLQNGAAVTSGSNVVQQLGPEWSVQGVGDFNGDGKADVLYRRSTDGLLYLDTMNGSAINFASSGFTAQQISDSHWQIAGIGDFDGDGKADLLWRYDNPSNPNDSLNGVVYEWAMNGTNVVSQGLISAQPGSDKWQVAGTGDFDGNGTADILFRYNNAANANDPLNGLTYIDFMNGTQVTSGAPTQWQIDNSWAIASIGDFNGDGKSDLLFQHAGDGNTYIWDMNGTATISGNFTSMQSGPGWAVQNGVLDG